MTAQSQPERKCASCGVPAPGVQTDFTLISARHGWRLRRTVLGDGSILMEWHCPTCWKQHRAKGR